MATKIFHLIGNAHLDPVWLWDWADGLNEGIITCRAILDLMDQNPQLTFSRGECAIYEHIERNAPDLFSRIEAYVQQGRWEVIGGTYIQPDENLPSTETLVRHYTRGQNYFKSRFGKTVRVGWSADCFGHPGGLPDILASAGIEAFAFTRPEEFAYKGPFWWYGPGGSRVLGYRPLCGWYGTDTAEMTTRLNLLFEKAQEMPYENVGVFYGLGNHGGGPSRRHLAEIAAWTAEHPDTTVVFSGLHRLVDALYGEARVSGDDYFPSHTGELQYVARGCYSSVAKLKFAYHKLESAVARAERTSAVVDAVAAGEANPRRLLSEAWDAVLFNTFHDILPGSSIERAYEQQIEWIGGAVHRARSVELASINKLASLVDTSVRPAQGYQPGGASILLWNPHPFSVSAPVELEANIDYRPNPAYVDRSDQLPFELIGPDGAPAICQRIQQEALCMDNAPWRIRVVAQPDLPPLGWAVYELAYREGAAPLTTPAAGYAAAPDPGAIENERYRVQATAGARGISISKDGKSLFDGVGFHVATVEDHGNSWGWTEETGSKFLNDVRSNWQTAAVETLEKGPLRSSLWVRLTSGSSALDLTFTLCAGRDAVDVGARLLWNERAARVRMIMPMDRATGGVYDMPGGAAARGEEGEVPGGRFARIASPGGGLGFASDNLSSFSVGEGLFGVTIARASRYAAGSAAGPEEDVFQPAVDRGELKFRFLLCSPDDVERMAAVLTQAPIAQTVLAGSGGLGRTGSFGALEGAGVRVLALKPAEDGRGLVIRLHNGAKSAQDAVLVLAGQRLNLGSIEAGRIASWRLTRVDNAWAASAADSLA